MTESESVALPLGYTPVAGIFLFESVADPSFLTHDWSRCLSAWLHPGRSERFRSRHISFARIFEGRNPTKIDGIFPVFPPFIFSRHVI